MPSFKHMHVIYGTMHVFCNHYNSKDLHKSNIESFEVYFRQSISSEKTIPAPAIYHPIIKKICVILDYVRFSKGL